MEEILFEYFCSGISSQTCRSGLKKTMDFFEKKMN